jgi:hypothetical protein
LLHSVNFSSQFCQFFITSTTAAAAATYSGIVSSNQPHHPNRNTRSGPPPKPIQKTPTHAPSRADFLTGELTHAPPSYPRVTARPAAVQVAICLVGLASLF